MVLRGLVQAFHGRLASPRLARVRLLEAARREVHRVVVGAAGRLLQLRVSPEPREEDRGLVLLLEAAPRARDLPSRHRPAARQGHPAACPGPLPRASLAVEESGSGHLR